MGILIGEPQVKWTAAQATARRLNYRHYKSVMRCEFCRRMPVVGYWISSHTSALEDKEVERSPVCQSCGDWIGFASHLLAKLNGKPGFSRFENWEQPEG